jgi:outer membrane murein-binding lipoprotein Lpp
LECDLLGIQQLNRIERKVDYIMAQIDDLNTALAAISTDVDATLSEVKSLEDQLAAANANPAVDLSGAIAAAAAIRAKLEGVSTTAASATA